MSERETIPGTITDPETRKLIWVKTGQLPVGPVYQAWTATGRLKAIVTHDEIEPGKKLWHISVSHPTRMPTWDEVKHAKYELVQADIPMVLIFPTRSEPYVNIHEFCLHLWEPENEI